MVAKWESEEGRNLVDLRREGLLGTVLPDHPGIYAWKVNLASRVLLWSDFQGIIDHIKKLMSVPQGETGGIQVGHSLFIDNVVIRGKSLEGKKEAALREWLKVRANAEWMIDHLRGLSGMMPCLYVGKADSLQPRIKQHLEEETGFGREVRRNPQLDWRDLQLYWTRVPTSDSTILETTEYILQSLSVSAYTKRVG